MTGARLVGTVLRKPTTKETTMTAQATAGDLPLAHTSEIRLEFHWSYYDGPRTGALRWRDRRLWFRETDRELVYELVELPIEQWTLIDEIQQLFRAHVGTHTTYDAAGHLDLAGVNPDQAGWARFYEDPRVTAEFTPNGAVVALWAPPA
jgi:hypothetical protein